MYKPGDFWRICDRTGFRVRASETAKEWNGLIVRDKSWEQRHPQDFVRGRYDKQVVSEPRPEPSGASVGPLVTSISATDGEDIGQTILSVVSSSGFSAGNIVYVAHEGGTLRTSIASVPDGTSLTLAVALPGLAPYGAPISNASVITTATDGY